MVLCHDYFKSRKNISEAGTSAAEVFGSIRKNKKNSNKLGYKFVNIMNSLEHVVLMKENIFDEMDCFYALISRR